MPPVLIAQPVKLVMTQLTEILQMIVLVKEDIMMMAQVKLVNNVFIIVISVIMVQHVLNAILSIIDK